MITDRHLIDTINKRMAEDYRVLDGRPIYRIVWSDDMLETRRGKFNYFYGSIFVKEQEEVRQIKKYWYMTPPRFVLEKLVFIRGQQALEGVAKELPEAVNGSYEPVYSFVDKNNNPLPVNIWVVDTVLWHLHTPLRHNPSDIEDDRLRSEAEEVKYFEEEIGRDERSPLFVFENSAFVSKNQMEYREKINAPVAAR